MSRKKEKQEPYVYEYVSKYCKVKNGRVVGLDMEKIAKRQQEIDNQVKKLKKGSQIANKHNE